MEAARLRGSLQAAIEIAGNLLPDAEGRKAIDLFIDACLEAGLEHCAASVAAHMTSKLFG